MRLLNLVAGSSSPLKYAVVALSFATFFFVFLFAFLALARRVAARKDLTGRLSKRELPPEQAARAALRRKRDPSAEGHSTMPMGWLRRLAAQSGVTWTPTAATLALIGISVPAAAFAFAVTGDPLLGIPGGASLGAGIPLLTMVAMRRRRQRKFEAQLPEAIETLVRALKAGHPVSAAIRMVVRELPDPIGTEFAIAADELTYGLDLETAIGNINRRVGQQDLALIVIAIGVQARSGGNLAELLAGIAKVIRDRLRMRMKVKALSAEGRFSALLLSVLPFGLFALLALIAPQFYGEIWASPFVKPVLLAATAWMIIGDLIMYRMVNFEI